MYSIPNALKRDESTRRIIRIMMKHSMEVVPTGLKYKTATEAVITILNRNMISFAEYLVFLSRNDPRNDCSIIQAADDTEKTIPTSVPLEPFVSR
jgi:hypothetical protein